MKSDSYHPGKGRGSRMKNSTKLYKKKTPSKEGRKLKVIRLATGRDNLGGGGGGLKSVDV